MILPFSSHTSLTQPSSPSLQAYALPAIGLPVQLHILIDLEFGWVCDAVAFAVVSAVLSVDSRVDFREESSFISFGKAILEFWYRNREVRRSQEGSAAF